MLTHIQIKNFAIVEQLQLDFESGLTVLTGETGAGKSILLDALGLALGDRADNSIIRVDCDRAEISLVFDTRNVTAAENWLKEHELDNHGECIIRRTINRNSGSRAFINGQPSPINSLRQLGEMLVDLHGQHEHQSLLRKNEQGHLVDSYAGNQALLKDVTQTWRQWRQLKEELLHLDQQQADRDAQLELLRFQVNELQQLNLQENELNDLDQEHRRLANSSRLMESCERILNLMDNDEQQTACSLLNQSITELTTLVELDDSLQPLLEGLNSAVFQLKETSREIRHYQQSSELEPRRLEWVEQRLADIHDVSRKNHVKAAQLAELLRQLKQQLADIEHSDNRIDALKQEIELAEKHYLTQAKTLTENRNKAASTLSSQVTQRIQQLGMEGGQFVVQLEPNTKQQYSATGMEKIEFQVTANPGQPLKPLTKVASGGELSRISLAIQVIAAEHDVSSTLIFDEVDVGIGGRVAEIVGRQLRELAQSRQVICVTHLPQVAALGHHHLQVSKHSEQNTTTSQIKPLTTDRRIDEIARMLGGIDITEQTLSHAKEMIERANNNTECLSEDIA